MIHKIEHSDLINMVRIIDVRHEFLKEWENDENMIRMFIDLNIGNFLPGDEDTFGSYLTNLMNFKGLTPTVLAERTGISYNTIYKYLSDYGHVDDIEYLLSTDSTTMTQGGIQNPRLAQALDELRIKNESWYEAVMDYYIRCENASYGVLARKYNVSKVEVFRRVTLGVEFLIEKMAK